MKRPDQDRFDLFVAHFDKINAVLEGFSSQHRFDFERNVVRQPGRVLRKKGNPHYLIDLALADDWRTQEYRDDLPYTMSVIAYFEPPENDQNILRIDEILAQKIAFSILIANLENYLTHALECIQYWTPEIIRLKGTEQENLRKKYGTGSLQDA